MPLFRGARPLKRWRYVGVFCEELMICAASVQVGPARQSFWAVLDRSDGTLLQRTHLLPRGGAIVLAPGRLTIEEKSITVELQLEERAAIEAICSHGSSPHGPSPQSPLSHDPFLRDPSPRGPSSQGPSPLGRSYVWTRKQAGVRAHGTLALPGGSPRAIEARAVIDDTAGYHARATEWRWAAGVGTSAAGDPVAFNLVEGVNDPPSHSERAVWVAGVPREAPPVRISEDLRTIACTDGTELRFEPEAERHRRDNLLLVRSEYRAPFGSFSGTLPGGVELAHALGVAEHHRARW